MKVIRHMCINLNGLVRNSGRKSMHGLFTKDNGKDCTNKEARDYIKECQAKGWKVIPAGSECEGFDYLGGGCPGHEPDID